MLGSATGGRRRARALVTAACFVTAIGGLITTPIGAATRSGQRFVVTRAVAVPDVTASASGAADLSSVTACVRARSLDGSDSLVGDVRYLHLRAGVGSDRTVVSGTKQTCLFGRYTKRFTLGASGSGVLWSTSCGLGGCGFWGQDRSGNAVSMVGRKADANGVVHDVGCVPSGGWTDWRIAKVQNADGSRLLVDSSDGASEHQAYLLDRAEVDATVAAPRPWEPADLGPALCHEAPAGLYPFADLTAGVTCEPGAQGFELTRWAMPLGVDGRWAPQYESAGSVPLGSGGRCYAVPIGGRPDALAVVVQGDTTTTVWTVPSTGVAAATRGATWSDSRWVQWISRDGARAVVSSGDQVSMVATDGSGEGALATGAFVAAAPDGSRVAVVTGYFGDGLLLLSVAG